MNQLAIDFEAPQPSATSDPEKPTILDVIRCKRDLFRADFPQWLADNFHIWKAFEREADRVWARGRAHYSARTIGEFIRHETALREDGGEFKVNDHAWPDCARLYTLLNPDRKLFEFRGERKAA